MVITIKSPSELAADLIALAAQLQSQTVMVARLDEESTRAKCRHEVEYARSFLSNAGSVDARKAQAIVDTAVSNLDTAIAAQKLRACQEQLRYIRTSLDVGRTLSATTRAEWVATNDGGTR